MLHIFQYIAVRATKNFVTNKVREISEQNLQLNIDISPTICIFDKVAIHFLQEESL